LPGALLVLQGMANVAAEAWQARAQGARQLAARQADTQVRKKTTKPVNYTTNPVNYTTNPVN
jgi:hypothetical protein